ncbi:cation-transporting P-type ATPase [Eubacterium callanderi]|uniref:cation-transporting P-type ATPase n=2 Tax=Eubacterium callanderi TaxID=53442 RepID=UPI0029FF01BA|nr:cation-transporting P-type ATPase [Eubacterium callanderi]
MVVKQVQISKKFVISICSFNGVKILKGVSLMKAFQETTSQTLERLNVDPELGLSKNQIEESRLKHGVNAFTKGKPKSVFKKIWDAATEPMIVMLLVAAAITLGVNFVRYFTGGQTEFIECIGIFAAIFLAVGVTVIMEGRSEKAFEALNQINEDVQVKVKRGGQRHPDIPKRSGGRGYYGGSHW